MGISEIEHAYAAGFMKTARNYGLMFTGLFPNLFFGRKTPNDFSPTEDLDRYLLGLRKTRVNNEIMRSMRRLNGNMLNGT